MRGEMRGRWGFFRGGNSGFERGCVHLETVSFVGINECCVCLRIKNLLFWSFQGMF